MRKIERNMIAAIRANKNLTIGNTYVNPVIGAVEVHLHGNHIATVTDMGVKFTLADWSTPTTRSRINALLREFVHGNAGVYESRGVQHYAAPEATNGWQGQTIGNHEWVQA